MWKKGMSVVLGIALLAGYLVGCGEAGTQAEAGTTTEKGRYVEQQLELPEGMNSGDIVQIDQTEKQLVVYTNSNQDGKATIKSYLYENFAEWNENTPEWLGQLNIPYLEYANVKLITGGDGTQYLYTYYADTEGEDSKGHLFKSADGVSMEEITPEDWLAEDPQFHYFDMPTDIAITSDNILIAKFYSKINLYKAEDSSLLQSFVDTTGAYKQSVYANGTGYVLLNRNDYDQMNGISFFNTDTDSVQTSYLYTQKTEGNSCFELGDDGTMYACAPDGIEVYDGDADLWTEVVKGSYTSLNMLSMWCTQMKIFEGDKYDRFYILYGMDSGEKVVMEYVYDPDIEILPQKELTVFSLYDSYTLQQAAAMYHQAHPDVVVSIDVAIPYEEQETADKADIINQFNTKLLNGEGADLIVVDDLNMDALISKGIFTDITDVVSEYESAGTLLTNITEAYKAEDKTYSIIPLRFGVELLVGKSIDVTKVNSIEALADTVSSMDVSAMGPTTSDDLVTTFAPFVISDLVQDKTLNTEALGTFLQQLKSIADNTGVVAKYTDTVYKGNIWDIASSVEAAFYMSDGNSQAMLPISAANLVKGTFTVFGDTYFPTLQIGINHTCEETELAKDFIRFALSEQVQYSDFYDGFPVNANALTSLIDMDRTNYEAYTDIEVGDGQYAEFKIKSFSHEEGEMLADMCRTINNRAITDTKIIQEIQLALPAYLSGSQTLEATVTTIEDALRIYLAE